MINFKKYIVLTSAVLGMSLFIAGCNETPQIDNPIVTEPVATPSPSTQSGYNSVFETYNERITELGLVINTPDEETLGNFPKLEAYEHMGTSESMLIVPKYNNSKITISKMEYTGERFIATDTLYTKESTPEGYGLLLYAPRTEGIPEIMITVTNKNKSIDYLIAEDGKNGHDKIEYLRLEGEDKDLVHDNEIITEVKDEAYLDGLNLFSSFAIDFDLDGKDEKLEVYCQGEVTKDGTHILDDGQNWTLIVRKDDKIYPLFEKSYIQLGGLEYMVYVDYDDYERIHVLFEYNSGAGVATYDCIYDLNEKAFLRTKVHSADNISVLQSWRAKVNY